MGKTAEITEEFLNNGGSGLGYDETNLPKIRDCFKLQCTCLGIQWNDRK